MSSSAYAAIGEISKEITWFRTEAPIDEEHRFKSMDLCSKMMDIMDTCHSNDTLIYSIRAWVGEIQRRYGNQ